MKYKVFSPLSGSPNAQMRDLLFEFPFLWLGRVLECTQVDFPKHVSHQISTNPPFHMLENLLLNWRTLADSDFTINLPLTLRKEGTHKNQQKKWDEEKHVFIKTCTSTAHMNTHSYIQSPVWGGDGGGCNGWLQCRKLQPCQKFFH